MVENPVAPQGGGALLPVSADTIAMNILSARSKMSVAHSVGKPRAHSMLWAQPSLRHRHAGAPPHTAPVSPCLRLSDAEQTGDPPGATSTNPNMSASIFGCGRQVQGGDIEIEAVNNLVAVAVAGVTSN